MADHETANDLAMDGAAMRTDEQVDADGRTPEEWLALITTAPRYWTRVLWILSAYLGIFISAWAYRPATFPWWGLGGLTGILGGELYRWWKVRASARSEFPGSWHVGGARLIRLDRRWWRFSRWRLSRVALVAHRRGPALLEAPSLRTQVESWLPFARIEWFAVAEACPGRSALVIVVDPRGAELLGSSGHGALLLRINAEQAEVRAALGEIGLVERSA